MAGKFLRWILILNFALLPFSCLGLQHGQDMESVVWELGEPNGKRKLSDGELWVYSGDITLQFRDGLLISAKGVAMEPAARVIEQEPEPEAVPGSENVEVEPQPAVADSSSTTTEPPAAVAESGERDNVDEDEELLKTAESISSPETVREAVEQFKEEYEETPSSVSLVSRVMEIVVPTIIQWIFLILAFKWVGAEAMTSALLLIALIDRLVILSVQWFFFDLLTFPTTFWADHLASFIVTLSLIMKLTHAKQLPTAIKVVLASKVAAFIAGYLLFLFLLTNL